MVHDGSSAQVQGRFAAGHDAIDAAHELSVRFVRAARLSARVEPVLSLVLEELLTNALTHGGAAGDAAFSIALEARDGHVVLRFSDNGCAFDPRTDRPPDPREVDYENAPPGGLGWPLVLYYFRLQGYERKAGHNRLTLESRARYA